MDVPKVAPNLLLQSCWNIVTLPWAFWEKLHTHTGIRMLNSDSSPREASLVVMVVLVGEKMEKITRISPTSRAEWNQIFKINQLLSHPRQLEWRLSFHFQTRRHEDFITAQCRVLSYRRLCIAWHFKNACRWLQPGDSVVWNIGPYTKRLWVQSQVKANT